MDGAAVVASGKTAEMLEAAEASLDLVAALLDTDIVRDGDLAVALRRRSASACIAAIWLCKLLPSYGLSKDRVAMLAF